MNKTALIALLTAGLAPALSAQILVDGSFDARGPSGSSLGEVVAEGDISGVHGSEANNAVIDSQFGTSSQLPGLLDGDQIYSEVENSAGSAVYGVFGGIGNDTRAITFYVDNSAANGVFNLQFDLMAVNLGSGDFSNNSLRVDIIQWADSGNPNQGQYQVFSDLRNEIYATNGIGNAITNIQTLTLDSLIQSTNSDLTTLDFTQITDSTSITLSPSDNLAVRFIASGVSLRDGGNNREWVAIDNVDLVPIPEPSSVALVAGALAASVLLLRRRRS